MDKRDKEFFEGAQKVGVTIRVNPTMTFERDTLILLAKSLKSNIKNYDKAITYLNKSKDIDFTEEIMTITREKFEVENLLINIERNI